MDGRAGKALRWALTALLFLALGLATSVAVAWGNAAWFEHRTMAYFNLMPAASARWPGVTAIAAEHDRRATAPAWSCDFTVRDGYVPGPVPAWSMIGDPPPADAVAALEFAAGWPRACLFWRIDRRLSDGALSTDYPEGSIDGHLPSSVFFSEGRDVVRLPARPIPANLLIDSAFWAAVVLVLFLAARLARRLTWRHRRRRKRCAACGYSLARIESENCPECGTNIHDVPSLIAMPRPFALAWMLIVLVALDGLFVFSFVLGGRDHALLRAAYDGDTATIRRLLDRGVDPEITMPVEFAETALMVAAAKGRTEAVRLLIDAGAKLDAPGGAGYRTALHRAAAAGHADVIRLLCDAGADVDARDSKRMTPLHAAAHHGRREAVAALLDRGADIGAKDHAGGTALHLAAEIGDLGLVKLLARRGAAINAGDDSRQTPMFHAVYAGHIETAEFLLERGADIGITTAEGQNFWCRIDEVLRSERLTRALIDSRADIDQVTRGGMTPLMFAALDESDEAVRFLLEHGADPTVADGDGTTALDVATSANRPIIHAAIREAAERDK